MHEQSDKEKLIDEIMSKEAVQDMDAHDQNALAKELKDDSITELDKKLARLNES